MHPLVPEGGQRAKPWRLSRKGGLSAELGSWAPGRDVSFSQALPTPLLQRLVDIMESLQKTTS